MQVVRDWDHTQLDFSVSATIPDAEPVPEPGTLALLGIGLSMSGRALKKKSRGL